MGIQRVLLIESNATMAEILSSLWQTCRAPSADDSQASHMITLEGL